MSDAWKYKPPVSTSAPFVEFAGGAFVAASTGKSKIKGPVNIQAPAGSTQRPLLHPSYEYTTRTPKVPTKLPDIVTKECKPLAATKLEEKNVLKAPGGELPGEKKKDAWGKAPEGIAKPKDGERLLIRAPPGGLKSKWAGVPPRPAAPPPLPTNEKLQKGMVVQIIKEDEMVQATFPDPVKNKVHGDQREHATHITDLSLSLTLCSLSPQDGKMEPSKWRLELKCKSWQRAVVSNSNTALQQPARAAPQQALTHTTLPSYAGGDGRDAHLPVQDPERAREGGKQGAVGERDDGRS